MKFTKYHRARFLNRRKRTGELYINGQFVGYSIGEVKITLKNEPFPLTNGETNAQ